MNKVKRAAEGYSLPVPEASNDSTPQDQSSTQDDPTPIPSTSDSYIALNDINAEFFDGTVTIHAVLDLDGLEGLEQQINNYKLLLSKKSQ